MIKSLLSLFAIGLVAILGVSLVLSVVGTAIGIASFLFFKAAPVLFLGWIVVKVYEKVRGPDSLSSTDQSWLGRD
jgi:hypothetical protein